MTFQVSNTKSRQFLDLLDDNLHPIEPLHTKYQIHKQWT